MGIQHWILQICSFKFQSPCNSSFSTLLYLLFVSLPDKTNKESVRTIEKSICIICLDAPMPRVSDDIYKSRVAAQMLHGGGSRWNSGNRWFDKTLQVSADGLSVLQELLFHENKKVQEIPENFRRFFLISRERRNRRDKAWWVTAWDPTASRAVTTSAHSCLRDFCFFYCLCPRLFSVAALCVPCKSIFCLQWTMPRLLGGSPTAGRSVPRISPRLVTSPVSARGCPVAFLFCFFLFQT